MFFNWEILLAQTETQVPACKRTNIDISAATSDLLGEFIE